MINPALVEVTRGARVESVHRGAIAVVDTEGGARVAIGDIDAPVFPRSAVKALQALALVESGAADAHGYGDELLALACSSHNAEDGHVAGVRSMLARAGLMELQLECGPQPPRPPADAGQSPLRVHNNCSGKHAGFLAAATRQGWASKGYVAPTHPLQRQIAATLEAVTGAPQIEAMRGVDGCSIPTYAAPLRALALGFARFVTGAGLPAQRAAAARRLESACMAHPFMVAGTGRFCTRIMTALPGRLFAKTGAEGVFCGALPELGLGVALKCEDGATRAAEVMMAQVAAALLDLDAAERGRLAPLLEPSIENWAGETVGAIRFALDTRELRR